MLPSRRSILLAGLACCLAPAARTAPPKAERVLVLKGERRLLLLKGPETLRTYPIRLGRNPMGPKIFQLDGRTPEGTYLIDRRTRSTPYRIALHISYPRPDNLARAARYNLPAGGGIYIHGTPGTGPRFEQDWTDGCIAVGNSAIEEIAALVEDGTPIDILP